MSRPAAGHTGSVPAPDEPPSIAARLTSLERVMGVVDSRVDDQYLRSARDVTRQITERLSLSPAHTVVALAGATGSGKSSIYNALAGLDLSEVGVRRPVTNAPHACVWGPDGAGPLLDWLSIPYDNRTARESALDADSQAELRGLVLLDLPDHDSTQLAHRLEVDRLVELVDLLVWVLDPQKYADEAVHSRYLRRLSRHAGVTVVVLNQVDLLSSADADACLADVRRLLDADGLRGVPLVPLSALRRDGLSELKDRITATVASRQAAVRRLAADLDDVAAELAPLAGPEVREDVDRGSAKRLYTTLAEAAGAGAVGEAVERGYKITASRNLGWPLVHWFGRSRADPLAPLRDEAGKGSRGKGRGRTTARPAVLHPVQRPQVEEALRNLADDAAHALPEPWPGLVHRAARSELDALPDALDRAVASADLGLTRRPAWWWAWRVVQYLLVLALFGGVAWTLGLAIAAAVGGADSAPDARALVLPAGLLFGGLVLGPLLHLVGVVSARRGARLARLRAEQAVLDAVTTVARERVLAPVRAELSAYAQVRDALIEFGVAVPRSARAASGGTEVDRDTHPGSDAAAAGGDDRPGGTTDRLPAGTDRPLTGADGSRADYPPALTDRPGAPADGSGAGTERPRSDADRPQASPDQPRPDAARAWPDAARSPADAAPPRADAAPPRADASRPRTVADRPGGGADDPAARAEAARRAGAPPVAEDAGSASTSDSGGPLDGSGPLARASHVPALSSSTPSTSAPHASTPGASSPETGQPMTDQPTPSHPGAMPSTASQPQPGRPGLPWQVAADRSGSVPPPPGPDGVRRGAIPPAPATPPFAPGVRPFVGGNTSGTNPPTGSGGFSEPGAIPSSTGTGPHAPGTPGGPAGAPRSSPARRSGPKLPPAPPPRPAVEADPEVVWARTRPAALRPTSPAAPPAAPGDFGSPLDARARTSASPASAGNASAPDRTQAGSDTGGEPAKPERKGLRGLFNRRRESADVVDRWWATTDDGDDPFGRPPAPDSDDSRPRVPGQR